MTRDQLLVCCCDYASACLQGGQRMTAKELDLLPAGIDD